MKTVEPSKEGKYYDMQKTVGVIAPSFSMSPKAIKRAIERLTELGFTVMYNKLPKALKESGTPQQRAKQLNEFFENPQIDIVWALRGGMGSSGLIPHIDFELLKKNKKLFIGYSDITSLQIAFEKHCDFPSYQFYLPGVKTWLTTEEDQQFLYNILHSKDYSVDILDEQIYSHGTASGEVVGGSLELVVTSLGTHYEVDTDNKILFVEAHRISPQRFINKLNHLKFAGKLDNIKGLVISKIIGCKGVEPYLESFLSGLDMDIPVLYYLDFGHTVRKIPIPLGSTCTINTEKKTLHFDPVPL